jgi:hypothetical protein
MRHVAVFAGRRRGIIHVQGQQTPRAPPRNPDEWCGAPAGQSIHLIAVSPTRTILDPRD